MAVRSTIGAAVLALVVVAVAAMVLALGGAGEGCQDASRSPRPSTANA